MGRRLAGFILACTLLTFVLFLPYTLNPFDALPNSVDPVFYAWNLSHNLHSAIHGFRNLLDTNIFYPEGNTLALSDTLYAQTIGTAPILFFSQNPILAENLYIFATFPLSALSLFLLARYLTGSAWASVIASLFYAFSYPRIAQIGHMPALSSQWLPLVFLYVVSYVRHGHLKYMILAFFWYLVTLASTVYFGIFLIPFIAIIAVLEYIDKKSVALRKTIRDLAIVAFPVIIITIIILFPYIRLRAEYPGIRRSLEDASRLSARPYDYLTVLPTSWLGDIGWPVDTNERPLYPTVTLLILGGLSLLLVSQKRRFTVFCFVLVTLLAYILSLGPYMGDLRLPYFYVYKILPLFESIRVPARLGIFVILGLSVLSAFSLKEIIKNKAGTAVSLMCVLLFFTEVWQVNTPYIRVPLKDKIPEEYAFLEKLPDDVIIAELPLIPEWAGKRMEDQLMVDYSTVTENDIYSLEAYRTYFSAFHRKRMLNGYSGYFPNIYHDNSIKLATFPSVESIQTLKKQNVRYLIVHANQYATTTFSDIESKIKKTSELTLVSQFGQNYIYELTK